MKTSHLTQYHNHLLQEIGLHEKEFDSLYVASYEPGEYIYQEGFPITWLGIVCQGKAKVCCSSTNGNHLVLCYFVSSGIIGGIEMMAHVSQATASLVTLTDFECIAIPFEHNLQTLKNNSVFLNHLCSQLSLNLLLSSRNFVSSALYTGKQRCCSYILESEHQSMFNDVLTDVACSIGLSYRHTLRILNELCTEGILAKKELGYKILDRTSLKENAIDSSPLHIEKV